jgi:hypothetical protein
MPRKKNKSNSPHLSEDTSKRKNVVKYTETEADGTVTKYKDKYRKSGKLKKRKIRDKKGLFGKNYSIAKIDKKGNVKRETGVFRFSGGGIIQHD